MTDLVVTVPRKSWPLWLGCGDLAGAAQPSGIEHGFRLFDCDRPPIEMGERLYIVAHDRLRGYAPVSEVVPIGTRNWMIKRRGAPVAVTISMRIAGFRHWRRVWWERADERPFPDWQTAGVFYPQAFAL